MTTTPSADDVRAELERVLSSPTFARARRAQAFLRHVTEETLAGRAAEINGHAIAVAVFGKGADFDAATDPLVRVEAGRLRSRLLEHYATLAGTEGVRIELPRGGYVPSFVLTKPAVPAAAEAAPIAPAVAGFRRHRAALAAAGAVVLAVVAAVSIYIGTLGSGGERAVRTGVPPPRAAGPRVFVQPFRDVGDEPSPHLAFGITEEVMTRLARYPDVQVFVGTSGYFDGGKPGGGRDAEAGPEPADASRMDYVLTGTLRSSGRTIRVEPRLVDARSGRQIWAATYDESYDVATLWSIVDALAGSVATTLGEPFGPLFGAEVAQVERSVARNADAYHCLLRFLFAVQTMSEGAHARATVCFEHAVTVEPGSSMNWARLAALYRMEYLHDFNARPDAPPALDRALEAVRKALDIDESNAFAHQELGFVSLLSNDEAAAEESFARALALNPSADIRAAIGVNFVKMGDTERGFALIGKGMAESPRAPPFFFLGYVVNALRTHDDEAAFLWAKRMAAPDWPLSQAVLAAVAARTGRDDVARRAVERLQRLRPEFAENGRELFRRGRLGADVEQQVVDGLARAGVVLR
ncbi:MAG TPA: hypothetical protein VHH11_17450 [Gammaproteobacteria bacterium]|nr:hypothetical protein [Gammaproteobacteria bacterium]